MAEPDRNILLFMMSDPTAQSLFGDGWATQAERMVALFRVAYDPRRQCRFRRSRRALTIASAAFAGWWRLHGVGLPDAGTKTLRSSGGTETPYVYASFQSNDDPAFKLALYRRCDAEV